MIRNTVRSLPAPRPKLPSRKESGTLIRASSVVRITRGRIIMAMVKAPPSMEYPQPKLTPKNKKPNRPYTMEGMPERVSAVIRTTPTSLLPRRAYSTR